MTRQDFTRRLFLSRSSLALAGITLAVRGGDALAVEPAEGLSTFSEEQRALLREIADIMIPETDTPGALASNTVAYVEGLMKDWASQDTKAVFGRFPVLMDRLAREDAEGAFMSMDRTHREVLLEKADQAAFEKAAPPWAEDYRKVKSLIFEIHYASAEANPDYVPIPGAYHGDLSLEQYQALVAERKYQ